MAIIACDLDGVIIDLLPAWLNEYNREFGDNLLPENITAWDISKFVKPEASKHIWKYLYNHDLYDYCYPITGAINGIRKLHDAKFRVVYVTSAPDGFAYGKYKWLKRYELLNSSDDFVVCSDKSLINADILIDDYGKNIQAFSVERGIFFAQPHVKYVKEYFGAIPIISNIATNWDEVYSMANSIIRGLYEID